MTRTDTPINVEAAQDPMTNDYDVSMCMCHTPRRIYVDNLTELGTGKSVHVYMERRTCKNTTEYSNFFICSGCGFEHDFIAENPKSRPRFCGGCGAEVIS